MAGTLEKLMQIQARAATPDSRSESGGGSEGKRPSTKPEWRMAFEIHEDLLPQILAAADGDNPAEAVVPVFQSAACRCSALFNKGSAIAARLAAAVYDSLEDEYKAAVSHKKPPCRPSGTGWTNTHTATPRASEEAERPEKRRENQTAYVDLL